MKKVSLEFCIWLQENFDVLMDTQTKAGMIAQAHRDAEEEKRSGPPGSQARRAFTAEVGGE